MQHRTERISEALREELAELIGYELSDPRINFATVSSVEVSPDKRHAFVRIGIPKVRTPKKPSPHLNMPASSCVISSRYAWSSSASRSCILRPMWQPNWGPAWTRSSSASRRAVHASSLVRL